jgi:hypothetical protein
MKAIPLHGQAAAGRAALIDDEDFDLVSHYRWHVSEVARPGCRPCGPYAAASLKRGGRTVTVLMHGLILGVKGIDHANGNGLDNQRANLRPATTGQNNANQSPRSGGSSTYKGVGWKRQRGAWYASIRVDGKLRHLGYFPSEEDAAHAYDAAAVAAWGEFARPNFAVKP